MPASALIEERTPDIVGVYTRAAILHVLQPSGRASETVTLLLAAACVETVSEKPVPPYTLQSCSSMGPWVWLPLRAFLPTFYRPVMPIGCIW